MSDPLETPRAIDDLYIARGTEVSFLRPIMTGDVLAGISIPGVEATEGDDEKFAMIVSHPCSMRDGYQMKPALQALRVVRSPVIELTAWKQHFDKMPLPNLTGRSGDDEIADPEDFYIALFDLRGRVPSKDITLDRRVACLSEEGVGFLHQRMGHADTRFAPRVADLVESCASPFAEAELAEEWNRQLLRFDDRVDPVKRDEILLGAAKEFDEVLSELRRAPSQTGKKQVQYRLRDDLSLPKKRPGARREINKIIKQRQAADNQSPAQR